MKNRKSLYQANTPFKLSRSKIELFVECPRCFYLDRRIGISRPPGFPFNLNSAVDALLKKEFDQYRELQLPHPLMIENNISAIPFKHESLNDWRMNQRGIRFLHPETQFLVYGAVDDIWINQTGELHIVDYKATSKNTSITLDADWQMGYKRQMEIYQWLFRQNGFHVSSKGYFVYCNGRKDLDKFDGKILFDITIIPHEGDNSWVENALLNIHVCLNGSLPLLSLDCQYCNYIHATNKTMNNYLEIA